MDAKKMMLMMDSPQYWQKIRALFGSSLIAYWPNRSNALDYSGNKLDGSGTNVTYDGTSGAFGGTSFVNIYSSGLNSAFNNSELSLLVMFKVSAAGVWTDGTVRTIFALAADTSNYVRISKSSTNNVVNFSYSGGGTDDTIVFTGINSTEWIDAALTVSKTADRINAYIDGVAWGTPGSTIGTWAGVLANTRCCLGSRTTAPNDPFTGFIAHAILLNRPATVTEINRVRNFL